MTFPPSGPWFVGELIDGHSGACFAFGVVIDGHFLEGSLTYVVGVIQVRMLILFRTSACMPPFKPSGDFSVCLSMSQALL